MRRDGRYLTLTLAAEAVSGKDIGEPTSKVKFDRLSQSVHKASSTRERRIGTRGIDVGGFLRILTSIVNLSSAGHVPATGPSCRSAAGPTGCCGQCGPPTKAR